MGLHKTVCVCVCVCVWNVLAELQRTSSVKTLIGCHSHLVSSKQITHGSQVSCGLKPVQV